MARTLEMMVRGFLNWVELGIPILTVGSKLPRARVLNYIKKKNTSELLVNTSNYVSWFCEQKFMGRATSYTEPFIRLSD